MINRVSWIFGLLLFSIQLLSQSSFVASVSQNVVEPGQAFTVEFQLDNAEASDFQEPNFAPFKKISGPSTRTALSSINGQTRIQSTWTYQLLAPLQTGKYRIPAATLVLKNQKTIQTKPIVIEVIQNENLAKNSIRDGKTIDTQKDYFLSVETNLNEAFPGQMIILNCKIYTKVNLAAIELLSVPDITESAYFRLSQNGNQTSEEIINGTRYLTKTIQRSVIFPQRPGLISIDPFVMRVAKEEENSGTNWFFFNQNLDYQTISSHPLTINIKPLPAPIPEEFQGVVGQFEANLFFDPPRPKAGQTVTATLKIRGSGDLKRIQAPEIKFPEGFETYDILPSEEKYSQLTSGIIGEKSFEYVLVPSLSGTFEVEITSVYFDTDSQTYVKLIPEPISLMVLPSDQKNVVQDTLSYGEEEISEIDDTFNGDDFRWQRWVAPSLLILASAGLLWFLLVYKKINSSKTQNVFTIDESINAIQKAYDSQNQELLFLEFQKAVYRWISIHTDVPKADLKRSAIEAYLEAQTMSEEDRDSFKALLKKADQLLYMPSGSSGVDSTDLKTILRLIEKYCQ